MLVGACTTANARLNSRDMAFNLRHVDKNGLQSLHHIQLADMVFIMPITMVFMVLLIRFWRFSVAGHGSKSGILFFNNDDRNFQDGYIGGVADKVTDKNYGVDDKVWLVLWVWHPTFAA
ncbi:hypothetical protein Tco_1251078 [Tanacetum coccineum]